MYPSNWKGLDFDALEKIHNATDHIPLVLHGGTGIPDDTVSYTHLQAQGRSQAGERSYHAAALYACDNSAHQRRAAQAPAQLLHLSLIHI